MEDVTDVVLNVKNLTVAPDGRAEGNEVTANKAGVITAADIIADRDKNYR
jgi:DNA-directed RNA polymerase alpha subunit